MWIVRAGLVVAGDDAEFESVETVEDIPYQLSTSLDLPGMIST